MITDFENPDGAAYVRWKFPSGFVDKQYANTVYGVVLAAGDGVAVVEPFEGHPNNAAIFNADGSLRVRLVNPLTSAGATCFMYPYYVGSELTIVDALPGVQFGCVFEPDGRLVRIYESR